MKPLRVGIDVDGVLANFNKGFANVLADVTGELNVYQSGEVEPSVWNWPLTIASEVEVDRAWARVRESRTFWRDLSPLDDANDALLVAENMVQDGHAVYFITSRPGIGVQDQTARWISCYSFIPHPAVLVCDLKPLAAAALRLDALIDDYPPNLDALPKRCQGFLVSRPWNAGEAVPHLTRVDSCVEALEQLL